MPKTRNVIVCTEFRGVFYGETTAPIGADPLILKNARMAIYWGTTKGVFELADTGPTARSRISALASRIELRKITAVFDVSPDAAKKWAAV